MSPTIRTMVGEDLTFARASWLHHIAKSSLPFVWEREGLDPDVLWRIVRGRVDEALAQGLTVVAQKPDGLLAGCLVVHHGHLQHAYVRRMDRGEGILGQLLVAGGLK